MNREWCSAIEIRAGDILKLANGKTAIVSKVYSETLSSPVTVYNFEVEDFHTYYVGEDSVLVHNECRLAKKEKLPTKGKIRYVPPKGVGDKLPQAPGEGYIDKFDNVWVKGKSRTLGEPFEWDVQLSRRGQHKLGWLSRDNSHINVSLDGRITHK